MGKKLYDALKVVSWILPPLATLLLGISELWNIPILVPIAGTVTLVESFLVSVLGASSKNFFKDKEIVPATKGVYGDGSDENE